MAFLGMFLEGCAILCMWVMIFIASHLILRCAPGYIVLLWFLIMGWSFLHLSAWVLELYGWKKRAGISVLIIIVTVSASFCMLDMARHLSVVSGMGSYGSMNFIGGMRSR